MSKRTRSQGMGERLVRNVTSLVFGEDEKERPPRSAGTRKRRPARSSGSKRKARTSRARRASSTRSAKKATRRSRGAR